MRVTSSISTWSSRTRTKGRGPRSPNAWTTGTGGRRRGAARRRRTRGSGNPASADNVVSFSAIPPRSIRISFGRGVVFFLTEVYSCYNRYKREDGVLYGYQPGL